MKNTLCFKILACIFLFGSVSCQDASEISEVIKDEPVDNSMHFGLEGAALPKLSEEVKLQITQWPIFEDYIFEATTMGGKTVEQLRTKTERLLPQADSLSKQLPDTLKTTLISSRLLVVDTRLKLLHQKVHRNRLDSLAVALDINELRMAVTNFVNQLNEKLQKDNIDFQRKDDEKKEIEKQKRFLDSVYRAELQDKSLK